MRWQTLPVKVININVVNKVLVCDLFLEAIAFAWWVSIEHRANRVINIIHFLVNFEQFLTYLT